MSNGENILRKCQVPGCEADSSIVVVYSARQSKDLPKYSRWCDLLNLSNVKPFVYACQRHFPAGAPTKNNPDPNIKLFNPIPKVNTQNDAEIVSSLEPFGDKFLDINGKPFSSSIYPPPGSIFKLSPNATLIDLKKIKEKQSFNKPIRIEEVTVIIDEQDTVKVIDYGPKDGTRRTMDSRIRNGKPKRRPLISSSWDEGEIIEDYVNTSIEPSFQKYQDTSLGIVLEKMRRLRIDCNLAIVDSRKRKYIYAHRAILVARSPYFYRQVYLRRKRKKLLYEFCRFVLPIEVDFDVVEAVISFIYTGSIDVLLHKNPSEVRELFTLFEMKDSLAMYNQEVLPGEIDTQKISSSIKIEPLEDELSVMVMPFHDDETTPVIEVNESRPEFDRKKRKRVSEIEGGEDYRGRLKVSVQKIVETALNPFLEKLDDLFNPPSTTLQIAETTQHIITLWHANILLTKIFDQNELTTFFSSVMNEILDKNVIQVKLQNDKSNELGSYTVETFYTQTGNALIDDAYTKPYIGGNVDDIIEQPSIQPIQTLTEGDMQIYNSMDPKHVSKFVHLIAMYRFNVVMNKRYKEELKRGSSNNNHGKDTLIPTLMEGENSNNDASNDIDDLVRMAHDGQLFSTASIRDSCFQQVNMDLKRRIVADLELFVNPSFHEELITHLIVDQMNAQNILPFTMGVFLGKGCNFCRKKECKLEDLTVPITPDNPVCPDRLCIKKNLLCNICNKQMSTSKSLARHKYGVHDIETGETAGIFICSHCGETFSKKWKLNIHEREHEDKKVELMCRYCKKRIKGTVAMKKHVTNVHEAKPQFSCEFCPKAFKRRETLSVHRRIHTGEKPFTCYHCEYASETKGNLKAHIIRKHKLSAIPFNSQAAQNSLLTDVKPDIIENQSEIMDEQNDHGMDEQNDHVMDDETHHVITEQSATHPSSDDHVMGATIVAHPLSDGSFIITSETSPAPIVP